MTRWMDRSKAVCARRDGPAGNELSVYLSDAIGIPDYMYDARDPSVMDMTTPMTFGPLWFGSRQVDVLRLSSSRACNSGNVGCISAGAFPVVEESAAYDTGGRRRESALVPMDLTATKRRGGMTKTII